MKVGLEYYTFCYSVSGKIEDVSAQLEGLTKEDFLLLKDNGWSGEVAQKIAKGHDQNLERVLQQAEEVGQPLNFHLEFQDALNWLLTYREKWLADLIDQTQVEQFKYTCGRLLEKHFGLHINDTDLHDDRVIRSWIASGCRPFEAINADAEDFDLTRIDSDFSSSRLDESDENEILRKSIACKMS